MKSSLIPKNFYDSWAFHDSTDEKVYPVFNLMESKCTKPLLSAHLQEYI